MLSVRFRPVFPFAATIMFPVDYIENVVPGENFVISGSLVSTSVLILQDAQGSWKEKVFGDSKQIGDEITTAEEGQYKELDLTFFSRI